MLSSSAGYQAAVVGSPRRSRILAVVDIISPDAVISPPIASSNAPWSKPQELSDHNFSAPARYATLEPGRWVLDGSVDVFPADYQVPEHMGYAGDVMCGEDGYFDPPQWVEQPFIGVDVLQALSVFFSSDPVDGVAEDFTVEVLSGETAYHTETFTGNLRSIVPVDGFTVYQPTSIRVTVSKWSLPRRRVRISDVLPGIYEEWTEDMLASFNAVLQGDFSCLSLPYGSVDLSMDNSSRRFEPRKKDSIFLSIEERQGIEIHLGIDLPDGGTEYKGLGLFYQSGTGWKTSDNDLAMKWHLVDILGLLANRAFLAPEILPTTLEGWLAAVVAQLGVNFTKRWQVDLAFAQKPVFANARKDVDRKRCGEIVRWACMAAGVWPRADAATGKLTAQPLWDQGGKLTLDNLKRYPSMKANESLAAIIFRLADEEGTEFVVAGNSPSSEKTVSVQNPFLHTKDQALTAARNILSCYGGNVLETTGRGDPSAEIGDVDTVWLDESNAAAARRKRQTFQFRDGVLQDCASTLLQPDGAALFQERAVFLENASFTTPAGVDTLRLILIERGADGQAGTPGGWDAPGTDGADGTGGKVLALTVSVNPEQTFSVSFGEHTVFGPYSSENGQVYPYGYTDIASGNTYARTGVEAPLAGSGDGGVGGKGGQKGVRTLETEYGITGRPIGSKWVVSVRPGAGTPGVEGATGCAVVYWDKQEAEI